MARCPSAVLAAIGFVIAIRELTKLHIFLAVA